MKRVVIVGGGWGGCAAAVETARRGVHTVLIERTDRLLGTGLVGGIMNNNGRKVAWEELRALGGGTLTEVIEGCFRHRDVSFPGHEHADLYDVGLIGSAVERCLARHGVTVEYGARIVSVDRKGKTLCRVSADDGRSWEGDVFIDATGTAGPAAVCARYGNGCAMCVLRCPSFGGRVSLTALAGVQEKTAKSPDGHIGSISGSCKLWKSSLKNDIVEALEQNGVVCLPLPPTLQEDLLERKACRQYALEAYRTHLVLLDTGHAKLMTPYFPLSDLRQIDGLERACYADPYAGGVGNSVRFTAMAPRNDALQVEGTDNLFCAGEKAGPLVGHTEALVTGTLAGYNAVQNVLNEPLLVLPRELAVGEAIALSREMLPEERCTFSGSVMFTRMLEKGWYPACSGQAVCRVEQCGLRNVFA